MQRIVTMILAATLLVVGLPSPQASAATKITLLYSASADWVGSFVAKERGFFDQRSLDADLSYAQNTSLMAAAPVAGSAQIGGTTPTVLLQANEEGLDLVVVAGTTFFPQPPGGFGMLARAGSAITGAKDLLGRKVGVPGFGGTIDVLSKKWVQSNGFDYRKVNWIELPFPQMGDALKSGLIDAAALPSPVYGQIIGNKIGYEIVDFNTILPRGTIGTVYAATRSWATKNADAVKAFRAALDDAVAYIKDPAHVSSVRDSIAKYTKLPPEAAATLTIPINLDAHVKPEGMKFWIEVSREQGLIKGNPDPASLIAP